MGHKFSIVINNKVYEVEVQEKNENEFLVKIGDREYVIYLPKEMLAGVEYREGGVVDRIAEATSRSVTRVEQQVVEQGLVITSEIPGRVIKLLVKEGDYVEQGQPIVVLESMKMAIEVRSPYRGRVKKVIAQEKSFLDIGQPIVILDTT